MFSSNSVKTFVIGLDNPSMSYFAGQIVTGRLILELERERKTSGIKLNFLGRANVRWTESHTVTTGTGSNRHTRTERRTYSDSETYFDQKVYVLGASGGPEIQLSPGYQEYPFSFQLPLGIPSSFKGQYGNIQYSLTATLKKSWGFDKTTTTVFTVNGIVDLNTMPEPASPSQISKQKHLGCLCCKDGPISFVFKLNRMGYVPGEGLDFVVEMNNLSSKPMKQMELQIYRKTVFYARGKSKSSSQVVATFIGPGVGPGDTELWLGNPNEAKIPPIPPTLTGCRIIKVDYSLHAELVVPVGFNLKGSTPLFIGTIPLRNNFEYMRPRIPEPAAYLVNPADFIGPTPMPLPSAPPLFIEGYPDLPPPSYEEACPGDLPSYQDTGVDVPDGSGDAVEDKKQNEFPYDPKFIPKYATYGWATMPGH